MGTVTNIETKRDETQPDPDLLVMLEALQEYVDNCNQAPDLIERNGVMQPNPVKLGRIQSVEYDGVEVGYRVIEEPDGVTCTREIFIHFEQAIGTIPDRERDPVLLAVYEAFLMEGQGEVEIDTFQFGHGRVQNPGNHDAMRIRQQFAPLLLEKTDGFGVRIDENIERLLGRE